MCERDQSETTSNLEMKISQKRVKIAVATDVVISRVLMLLDEKLVITCLKCAKLEPFFVVSEGKVLWQASRVFYFISSIEYLILAPVCTNTSHISQLPQSC